MKPCICWCCFHFPFFMILEWTFSGGIGAMFTFQSLLGIVVPVYMGWSTGPWTGTEWLAGGRWCQAQPAPQAEKLDTCRHKKIAHFGPQEEQKRNDRFQDNIKKAGVLRATVLSLSNWRDSEWVMIQNGSCGMEMYGVWTQRPSCFTLCVHVDAGRLRFFLILKLHIRLNWYVPFSAEYVYTSVYLLP